MAEPKYHRVANVLRREIREGTLAPGDRVQAETDLAERFNVSLPTIRQAMSVLRTEGLIESRQGIGTFVKDQRRRQRRSRDRYGRARKDQKLLTADLRHEITFAGRSVAPDGIAELMTLPAGAEVVIRRRTLFDKRTGRPEEIGASYLPLSFAADTFLERPMVVPKALFLCVEDLSGKRYSHARDQWIVRPASPQESETLDIPANSPVLNVIHVACAEDGQVLEVSESTWPADRIMLVDEYEIDQEANEPEAPSEI
ncbi:GntR family transcriptional regulator [Actinoallomurus liliacearum]|uniref:GntR family transcriptional regulator n=1 Tax=Actinoallomurus liliacearum TaxID=1080073 RepID=A0ABP8TXJ2_9ACTN